MSDHLFPRVRSRRRLEWRLAALAAVMLGLFGLVSAYLGASFVGLAGGDVAATARVATLGDSLGVNSSVRFRGLRVGRVVSVDSDRADDRTYGARVVIEDQYAGSIPAGVKARVLPGTLFGAEYVELVEDKRGTSSTLHDGAVIQADTSTGTVRLMDTFSVLQRVISAVDPAALDLAMSQLAGALDGKGDNLRRFIGRADQLVGTFSEAEPAFYRDLDLLARDLDLLADIEPSLVAALRDSLPLARTVATKARAIERLMSASTRLSAHVSAFLEKEGERFALFLEEVAPTYNAFVGGIGPFTEILQRAPQVLANGARSIKDGAVQMLALFGSARPGTYTAADCPRYGSMKGANCR